MSNITIPSQLHSNRPPLSDVPAVYFVSPTLANIRRIAEDLEKNTYESFHLSFVEPLPRATLEELAASVAKDGTGDLVEQVGELNKSLLIRCQYRTYTTAGSRPVLVFFMPIAIPFLPYTTRRCSFVFQHSICT